MPSYHLDGLTKSGILNHVQGALANYYLLARHNGFFPSLKYLWFEMLGSKKLIQARYAGHRILVRTCSPDLIVARWCLEGNEFSFLTEFLGNVKVIVDGGAYIGISALALADTFPQSRIFAIEPDPENYDLLVRNTADARNIIPINAALVAESGAVTLFDRENGPWGFSALQQVGGRKRAEVPGLSMTDLMEQFDLDHVDVLKLDIEGAEKAVLENSEDWITSVSVIYAELHERFVPGTLRAFFRATEGFEDVCTSGEKLCTINHLPMEKALQSRLELS
jgi:FkbM family methyltransferase